ANRVAWARAHMKAAGLLETVERGKFRITREGISVLATTPTEITSKYLEQFPGYLEFRTRKPSDEASPTVLDGEQTPEESLEANYLSLRDSLAGELLGRVKAGTPRFFEQLVVDLLVAMGYGGSRQDAGEA